MKDGIHPEGYEVKRKQTNADRIRSMTDEELAEFFINYKNTFGEEYEGKMSCLDWLKSEAQEEGGENE
jgi:hypothetical protein